MNAHRTLMQPRTAGRLLATTLLSMFLAANSAANAQSTLASSSSYTQTYDMVQLQSRPATIDLPQNLTTPIFFEDTIEEIVSGNPDLFSAEVNASGNAIYLRPKAKAGFTDMYVTMSSGLTLGFIVRATTGSLSPVRIQIRMPHVGSVRPADQGDVVPARTTAGLTTVSTAVSGQLVNPAPSAASVLAARLLKTLPAVTAVTTPTASTTSTTTTVTSVSSAVQPAPPAPMPALQMPVMQTPVMQTPVMQTPAPAVARPALSNKVNLNTELVAENNALTVNYNLSNGTEAALNFNPRSDLKVTSAGRAIRFSLTRAGGLSSSDVQSGTSETGSLRIDNLASLSDIEVSWSVGTGTSRSSFTRSYDPKALIR